MHDKNIKMNFNINHNAQLLSIYLSLLASYVGELYALFLCASWPSLLPLNSISICVAENKRILFPSLYPHILSSPGSRLKQLSRTKLFSQNFYFFFFASFSTFFFSLLCSGRLCISFAFNSVDFFRLD